MHLLVPISIAVLAVSSTVNALPTTYPGQSLSTDSWAGITNVSPETCGSECSFRYGGSFDKRNEDDGHSSAKKSRKAGKPYHLTDSDDRAGDGPDSEGDQDDGTEDSRKPGEAWFNPSSVQKRGQNDETSPKNTAPSESTKGDDQGVVFNVDVAHPAEAKNSKKTKMKANEKLFLDELDPDDDEEIDPDFDDLEEIAPDPIDDVVDDVD